MKLERFALRFTCVSPRRMGAIKDMFRFCNFAQARMPLATHWCRLLPAPPAHCGTRGIWLQFLGWSTSWTRSRSRSPLLHVAFRTETKRARERWSRNGGRGGARHGRTGHGGSRIGGRGEVRQGRASQGSAVMARPVLTWQDAAVEAGLGEAVVERHDGAGPG
jgi:hypothetical protein